MIFYNINIIIIYNTMGYRNSSQVNMGSDGGGCGWLIILIIIVVIILLCV